MFNLVYEVELHGDLGVEPRERSQQELDPLQTYQLAHEKQAPRPPGIGHPRGREAEDLRVDPVWDHVLASGHAAKFALLQACFGARQRHDGVGTADHVVHCDTPVSAGILKTVASKRQADRRLSRRRRHSTRGEMMDMHHVVAVKVKRGRMPMFHNRVATCTKALDEHRLGGLGHRAAVLCRLAEDAADEKNAHRQRWSDRRFRPGTAAEVYPRIEWPAMLSRVRALAAPTAPAGGCRADTDPALPRLRPLAPQLDRAALAALTIGVAALVLYAVSPDGDRFVASVAAIISFALAPALFPSVRARLETPVCPINWVLLVFFFQLVIDPLLICYFGPFLNTLPVLPSDDAVNASLLVSVVAWAGFVAGAEIASRRKPAMPRFVRTLLSRRRPHVAPNRIALTFALIGAVGVGLAFHSPGALLDYFHKAGGHVGLEGDSGKSGLVQSLSVLLRPCLAFALIIPWCGWIDRRRPDQRLVWRTLAIMALVLLASSTYSYNRAAAVAPIVAMVAVYGLCVLRLRFSTLLMMAVLALGILTAARAYRNTNFTISQAIISPGARHAVLANANLNHEIQIYTSAPQFLGYLLERSGWGNDPHYGRTLVSSAMYPVPHLGAPFRATSGVAIYNHLIYGARSTTVDQIAPFQGELFMDFTIPGVMAGYLCLALGLTQLQRGFERSTSAITAFACQYSAIWLGFLVIGSLAVFSQILIYFFWPIAVFGLLKPRSTARPGSSD